MAIRVVPFFSPITPDSLRENVYEKLRMDSIEIVNPEDFASKRSSESEHHQELIYFVVGSGGSENLIEEFIKNSGLNPPFILLSYNLNNSLPAAMETRASLAQQGLQSKIVHGSLDDLAEQLQNRTKYASIIEGIRKSRLGIIGKPSHWLIASGVDDSSVEKRWGLTIEHYPSSMLLDNIAPELNKESEHLLHSFLNKAECNDIPVEEIEKAARVSQRVSEIVESERLDAVTIECFDLLMKTKISGCYSLSTLNENENFAAGCEGDIPSTFTMMVAKHVCGRPVFMANVSDVDVVSNFATFAHCTLPTSLASRYRIMTHYETGMSLGVRGTFDPQRITVLKISGEDLSQYWVCGGEIIENLENEIACRTQIRVKLDEPVSYFLEESLANHHIIILGDFVEEFKNFFSFAIEGW